MKKVYQFTLVLKNVDENTPGIEDSLYEVGCDDALINFRDGTVYLDFDREAKSLKDAVISAIQDVESSSSGAIVINVAPEDWVTESEIAKRTSSSRQVVSLWTKNKRRKSFPKPIMKLSDRSPFWKWREITEWLYCNELISKNAVEEAEFLENINFVLEERNPRIKIIRQRLIKEIEMIGTLKSGLPKAKGYTELLNKNEYNNIKPDPKHSSL